MSLVVGMSVPNDSSVIAGLLFTAISTILLVSSYVSKITHAKIIHKLLQMEETNYELTEVVIALNEKVYSMNSKWKRKYASVKDKITTLCAKDDIETFQTTMEFQDTMNCEEFVNVKEKLASIETSITSFHEKYDALRQKMNEMDTSLNCLERCPSDFNELLQLLNKIDDSVSNEMNDVRLELASYNERIQMDAECNGKNRQDMNKLTDTVTLALKSIDETTSAMEQVTTRVDILEKDTMYAYGKCVRHTTMGYGSIASPVVDGNIYILFDYSPFVNEDGDRSRFNSTEVKCSDITIEPRKSRKAHDNDLFSVKRKDLADAFIRGTFTRNNEYLRILGVHNVDKFGMGSVSSREFANGIEISALADLDTETNCLILHPHENCTIVRVRTFFDRLSVYTG